MQKGLRCLPFCWHPTQLSTPGHPFSVAEFVGQSCSCDPAECWSDWEEWWGGGNHPFRCVSVLRAHTVFNRAHTACLCVRSKVRVGVVFVDVLFLIKARANAFLVRLRKCFPTPAGVMLLWWSVVRDSGRFLDPSSLNYLCFLCFLILHKF